MSGKRLKGSETGFVSSSSGEDLAGDVGGDRDLAGRFVRGRRPGPGRRKKITAAFVGKLSRNELAGLIEPNGGALYVTAMQMRDRAKWMESIRKDFDVGIVERIENLVEMSDAASAELARRVPLDDRGGEG